MRDRELLHRRSMPGSGLLRTGVAFRGCDGEVGVCPMDRLQDKLVPEQQEVPTAFVQWPILSELRFRHGADLSIL